MNETKPTIDEIVDQISKRLTVCEARSTQKVSAGHKGPLDGINGLPLIAIEVRPDFRPYLQVRRAGAEKPWNEFEEERINEELLLKFWIDNRVLDYICDDEGGKIKYPIHFPPFQMEERADRWPLFWKPYILGVYSIDPKKTDDLLVIVSRLPEITEEQRKVALETLQSGKNL